MLTKQHVQATFEPTAPLTSAFLILSFRSLQSIKHHSVSCITGSKRLLNRQRYLLQRLDTVLRQISDSQWNEKDPAGDL